jgi:hypothetical protein
VAIDGEKVEVMGGFWDSREQWERFGERLMPVLADVGIQPGEPDVFEVQNIVRRS